MPEIGENENNSRNKENLKGRNTGLAGKLKSLQSFIHYFHEEQKQSPWQSLIGPGPVSKE